VGDAADAFLGRFLAAFGVRLGVDEAGGDLAPGSGFVLGENVPDVALGGVEGRGQVLGEVRGHLEPVGQRSGEALGSVGQREEPLFGAVDPTEPDDPEHVEDDEDQAGDDEEEEALSALRHKQHDLILKGPLG